MFVKYFVYSDVFFCAFGGVLKNGNQKKKKEIVFTMYITIIR